MYIIDRLLTGPYNIEEMKSVIQFALDNVHRTEEDGLASLALVEEVFKNWSEIKSGKLGYEMELKKRENLIQEGKEDANT